MYICFAIDCFLLLVDGDGEMVMVNFCDKDLISAEAFHVVGSPWTNLSLINSPIRFLFLGVVGGLSGANMAPPAAPHPLPYRLSSELRLALALYEQDIQHIHINSLDSTYPPPWRALSVVIVSKGRMPSLLALQGESSTQISTSFSHDLAFALESSLIRTALF